MIRTRFTASLLAVLAAGALVLPLAAQDDAVRVVILTRHAEKAQGDDPDLSEPGRRRAQTLAHVLSEWPVEAIYTSQFKRTRQTAEPLAAATGIAAEIVDARDMDALLERVRSGEERAIVVVGHSNTVPAIARALGAPGVKDIPEEGYDDLLIVTVPASGKASLLHLKYGVATPY